MADSENSNILVSIRELKASEPFIRFTIVLTSGDRYPIEVAENLVEMKSELFYAYRGGEKFVLIRINQIAAVERPGEKKSSSRRKAS
jgi:hypothetical protein